MRDQLKPAEVFYYADEFNLSWFPTLRAMWSPKGQQVMIPTPGQPKKHYGLGAVNYHTGETVVLIRKRKRRSEIAQLLQALLDKHPTGAIYLAWDNVCTHQDDEIEAVVRAAAGRLVLLYLPTYSPWLNPIEMLWRHYRREVTHCELFETVHALLDATRDFFARYNEIPEGIAFFQQQKQFNDRYSRADNHRFPIKNVWIADNVSCHSALIIRYSCNSKILTLYR